MMVTKLLFFIIAGLCFLTPRIANGQLICRGNQSRENLSSCDVRLRTELLNKEALKGDDDISGLKLRLRLNYTSQCDERLLVYKWSQIVTHYRISKDAESLKSKRFIVSNTLLILTENEPSANDITLSDFAILSKAKPFETELDVRVFYNSDLIKNGSFVLQIDVETLSFKEKDSQELSRKFSSNGTILTGVISSEPMQFSIE